MRLVAASLICLLASFSAPRSAAADPVVVELFTSQGCSACPPVDALLREMRDDEGVLPLSLHVDYWDYLGWADSFATAAATRRQKAYAHAMGSMMVYTPQMIVDGEAVIAGFKPSKVVGAIMAAQRTPPAVEIAVNRDGQAVVVEVVANAPLETDATLVLVRFIDDAKVSITRGENAGRSLQYANIVTEWTTLATWNGGQPLRVEATLSPPLSSAVLVQAAGPGPVLAAARLD